MNMHKMNDTRKLWQLRLFVAGVASLLMMGNVGCDEASVVKSSGQAADNSTEVGDDEGAEDHYQPMDEHGHGSTAEERDIAEPGFMNGSWRVATGENDEPAAYFDTFQDKGDAQVSGTYLMGFAIYERYDGESGDIVSATLDGETLTVRWNPTTDRDEMFTLQATRVDENTLEGTVTAKRNVDLEIPVTLTRQTIN